MSAFVVAAAICMTLNSGTQAEAAKQADSPTQMVESFLSDLGRGEMDKAFEQLFGGSLLASQPTQMQVLKSQIQSAMAVFGKTLGAELYSEKHYGESVVRLIYIQRLEKHPLIWKFWVYRGPTGWRANAVVFNDQFNFE